ncbi:amidohydrolase [Thermotoga sp. Ku-13t]|uniref:amidohydrolase n=1 Tax=Thermotoga sp. Ku-13t TaxID=1755813 RepID=UPI0013EDC2BC|nr:amidohydrolase [Thermotoga sp. Ku-13t]KAF2957782.1 amidohydrolase [Thermotoga sp. Ku-13t]
MKLLFKNATVFPITSKPFVGDVLVEDGKISKVGQIKPTRSVEVIDLEGKFLLPGFIDAHAHIGLYPEGLGSTESEGNETTDPVTAHLQALDAFYPEDESIKKALSGGVTTAFVVMGSGNPVGGMGFIAKFKGKTVMDMCLVNPAGVKMALGENPKRVYSEKKMMPTTRMGTAAVIRTFLLKSQDYMKKKEQALKEGKEFLERDPKYEVGEKLLKRELPARIHAHRMDDIVTAIRLAEEFNLRIVLEHCTEGYRVADLLASKKIPVVAGPLMTFATKLELRNMTMEALKILVEKKVLVALMCDHPVIPLEFASVQAATAMRYGMKEEELLKMLTINPAKILGLEERIGSIEVGKDADLVVWSGHPFDMKSVVERVYIDGQLVYSK